jgi:muramoyltetrapeptide carboxypeptidase
MIPVKPARLRFGDTIGIIAPASAAASPEGFARSAAALEKLGFKAKFSTHVRRQLGFLAGTDTERAADLMSMFTDDEVKAIICLRGGYGSARILPLLDFEVIRQHPKIFLGYSDITSLHCALRAQAGLVSFHGPMLLGALENPEIPPFTLDSLLKTIMQPVPAGPISEGLGVKTVVTIHGGRASGELIGGNLSVLVTTLGTPYQPPFAGRLLFLEDIDEMPYRCDRMLTHLLNAGVLSQFAGVAVGITANCDDPDPGIRGVYQHMIADVLAERLGGLGVPVVRNLPFGHVALNATLPVGVRATLDADAGELVIEEAAVL